MNRRIDMKTQMRLWAAIAIVVMLAAVTGMRALSRTLKQITSAICRYHWMQSEHWIWGVRESLLPRIIPTATPIS